MTESLWSYCGGPFFWLLVVMAAAVVLLFALRFISFRRIHVDPDDFVRGVGTLMRQGQTDEALAICTETEGPVARIAATALHHREGSVRALRDAVDASGRAEVSRLARRLVALSLLAQAAPLVGLLGAVNGLIDTMLALNREVLVSRGDLLSGVVGSLTTVAAGLVVALVAQLAYGFLRNRFDRLIAEMEAAAGEMLSLVAAQREEAHG